LMYAWAPFVDFGSRPVRLQVVALFDAIKFIAFLPALVWIFGAWPSNYRIERPLEP